MRGTTTVAIHALVACLVSTSSAAQAYCSLELPTPLFPFEGQVVPSNAELLVLFALQPSEGTLLLPDGTTVDVTIEPGDVGARVVVPAPLLPGAHRLEVLQRVIEFEASDETDTEVPSPPLVTTLRETRLVRFPFGECPDGGLGDFVTLHVDGAGAGDRVIVVDGVGVATADDGATASVTRRDDRGGTAQYEVSLRDLAGNQSAPTVVDEWLGCEGGCSSAGALSPLAAVLLVLGRVRSRRSTWRVRWSFVTRPPPPAPPPGSGAGSRRFTVALAPVHAALRRAHRCRRRACRHLSSCVCAPSPPVLGARAGEWGARRHTAR